MAARKKDPVYARLQEANVWVSRSPVGPKPTKSGVYTLARCYAVGTKLSQSYMEKFCGELTSVFAGSKVVGSELFEAPGYLPTLIVRVRVPALYRC